MFIAATSIASTASPRHNTIVRNSVRLITAGVLAVLLAGCDDDDPWEDFQPFDAPNSVGIADMNADGRNDVVVAYTHINGPYPNPGYASVILQTASPGTAGTFARGMDSAVSANPSTIAVSNIDNLGSPDVAVANAYSGNVSVLLQSASTGQLSTSVTLSVGGVPFDVALGSLDNDLLAEVVVANASSSNITVFHQDSAGVFAAPMTLAVGNLSTAVAIGNVNNLGNNDIVVANQDPGGNSGRISIFYSDSNTLTYLPRVDVAAGTEPIAVKIADVDANGLADLIVANEGPGTLFAGTSGVTVIRQNPAGTFLPPETYTTARGTVSVAVGDVNGDGALDIVTANRGGSPDGTVSVLLQSTTQGIFLAAVNYTAICEPLGVAIGDLNNDTFPDIAIADGKRAAVMFNSNTGSGVFAAPSRIGE
jgi:hypothetical protein